MERELFNVDDVARLIEIVESSTMTDDGRGGVRNLLDAKVFRDFAESIKLKDLAREILGDHAFVVRGILFDKTHSANWKVPWHQDVTIAVTERVDKEGYGSWSLKAGVMHVQPPAGVLEGMVSVRVHLDDCPAENGALRVLPKTHCSGKLSQQKTE